MKNIIKSQTWLSTHTHTQNNNAECDLEMSIVEGWMEEKGSKRTKQIKSSYEFKNKIKLKKNPHMIARHSQSESWSVVPTHCDPMDYRVHGILQTRILEWIAFPFPRGSSQLRVRTQVFGIAGRFFTSWATSKAQEYQSGYSISPPEDLPNPGIKPGSPALQADSLSTELWGKLIHIS